jgi:hypothetical protein
MQLMVLLLEEIVSLPLPFAALDIWCPLMFRPLRSLLVREQRPVTPSSWLVRELTDRYALVVFALTLLVSWAS